MKSISKCPQNIKAPIILAHSLDDLVIPSSHSHKLFEAMLDPLLPTVPTPPSGILELSSFDWTSHNEAQEKRRARRSELVHVQEVEEFGTVRRFATTHGYDFVFVETRWGSHDRVGLQETVMDIVDAVFFRK